MATEEILQLISDSIWLLPEEKYYLMIAVKKWKVDAEKVKSLKEILIKEKKDIGERIVSYKEKCLALVSSIEEEKYTTIDIQKIKTKIQKIRQKAKKMNISIQEAWDKDTADDMLLHIA